ncbi:MAG: OsmC family protein [Roseibium sp.]|uniref:OsmC family protein n=1 Tax=Roseibium sp. TaxID=1936156 RepID=UPI0026115532|nr:OsmC family protein [Roseibium sp.]MCV0429788.1 OsmC family protein [Roseibium sp.]
MRIKEKQIWTFRVTGRQETNTKSVVSARDVSMVIDEPIERGGTNLGPMPVETMIAGLVGCTHVISNKLAEANGVRITEMDIDVVTTMDSRGTRLIEPIDIPFPDVKISITAEMDGTEEGISAVVEKLRHHCAVSKMLQMSGSRVAETWKINGSTWNAEAA